MIHYSHGLLAALPRPTPISSQELIRERERLRRELLRRIVDRETKRQTLRCLNLVGGQEPEARFVPGFGTQKITHFEHGVADAPDPRRRWFQTYGCAKATFCHGSICLQISG